MSLNARQSCPLDQEHRDSQPVLSAFFCSVLIVLSAFSHASEKTDARPADMDQREAMRLQMLQRERLDESLSRWGEDIEAFMPGVLVELFQGPEFPSVEPQAGMALLRAAFSNRRTAKIVRDLQTLEEKQRCEVLGHWINRHWETWERLQALPRPSAEREIRFSLTNHPEGGPNATATTLALVALMVIAGNTDCDSLREPLRPVVEHALSLRDAAMAAGDLGTEANTLRNSLYCRPALATAALAHAVAAQTADVSVQQDWIVLEDPLRAGTYPPPAIVRAAEPPAGSLRLRVVSEISEEAFRRLIEPRLAAR